MGRKKENKNRKETTLSEESHKKIEQGFKKNNEVKIEKTNLSKLLENEHVVESNNSQISQERQDKLRVIMNEINKSMGDSTMMKFGSDEPPKESINFGIKAIDELLGGGAVIGNFIVIYGSEGVGKSTLAYCQIAEAQKQGKICAYIDLEHSFTKERATQFGVKIEELVLIENCETAEDAMNISIKLAKEKVCDLIVLDSVNAMSPHDEQYEGKGEKEREMEKEEMALLAKKLGKFLRRVAPFIYKGKVAYLLIGQVRTEGIGGFATREGLSGGHGIKHWSMLTVYLRKGQAVDAPTEKYKDEEGKSKDRRIGFDCVLKIDKTKKTASKSELSDLHIPYYFEQGFGG